MGSQPRVYGVYRVSGSGCQGLRVFQGPGVRGFRVFALRG